LRNGPNPSPKQFFSNLLYTLPDPIAFLYVFISSLVILSNNQPILQDGFLMKEFFFPSFLADVSQLKRVEPHLPSLFFRALAFVVAMIFVYLASHFFHLLLSTLLPTSLLIHRGGPSARQLIASPSPKVHMSLQPGTIPNTFYPISAQGIPAEYKCLFPTFLSISIFSFYILTFPPPFSFWLLFGRNSAIVLVPHNN